MAAFAQQVIKDYVISNPLPPHVLQLPNSIAPNANMFIVSKTLRAPFQVCMSMDDEGDGRGVKEDQLNLYTLSLSIH